MSLTIPTVKQEIRDLKEQRATIDRKIHALEDFLGSQGNGGGISARKEADIRPVVEDIFKANNNQPLQVKNIVEEVSKRHPNMDRQIIEKKMFNVIRTILVKKSYGKYCLKTETPEAETVESG